MNGQQFSYIEDLLVKPRIPFNPMEFWGIKRLCQELEIRATTVGCGANPLIELPLSPEELNVFRFIFSRVAWTPDEIAILQQAFADPQPQAAPPPTLEMPDNYKVEPIPVPESARLEPVAANPYAVKPELYTPEKTKPTRKRH